MTSIFIKIYLKIIRLEHAIKNINTQQAAYDVNLFLEVIGYLHNIKKNAYDKINLFMLCIQMLMIWPSRLSFVLKIKIQ